MNHTLTPAAVAKLKRVLRANAGDSSVRRTPNAISFDDYPRPYAVQWSETLSSWLIWIPDSYQVLYVDGVATNVTTGLAAAGDPYPNGWYKLTTLPEEGGVLALGVGLKSSAANYRKVYFMSSLEVGSESEYCIMIADAKRDPATGEAAVKQFVSSALVITSPNAAGGGGGGGETSGITGSFDLVTGSKYSIISHKLVNHRKTFTFTNGILTSVDDKYDQDVFEATPHVTSS